MTASHRFTVRDSADASPRCRLVRIDLGGTAFPFAAGQAVMAGLAAAGASKPYSLACTPAQAIGSGCIELLVGVDPQDRQTTHLGFAAPGDAVLVSDPMGSFVLPASMAPHHLLLIAGGSGVAPLRAQLWDALERHESLRVSLVYSARTDHDFCFEQEFSRLHDEQRIRYLPTATREASPGWEGHRGRVDGAWLATLLTSDATLCSVCGPKTFVTDVTRALADAGVPPDNILRERY